MTEDGYLGDRTLVQRYLREGDQAAFRDLYARHTPSVLRFVLRHVRWNREDAEDVVQGTWLRAFRSLGRFRWESSLRTWLLGIALNRARDLVRSRNRLSDRPLVEVPLVGGRPPDILVRLDLSRAVEKLPDRARSVFVLHDLEGYTHSQISRALGITEGTSKSQLSRARVKIRRGLSGRWDGHLQ